MAQTIIVDISTRGANPVAYTHQGDTGRTFFAEIYENGEAFAVAGYTIKVGAILPADRGYTVIAGNDMVTATKTNDNTTNKIYFTLSNKYSLKAGNGILTLIFTSNTGTPSTIRPINIDLRIQKSADADDTIAGASDFAPVLERYMAEDMQTYINAWLDAHPEAMQYYISGSKLVLDENGILSIQNDTDEIVEALDLDTLRSEVSDLKSDLDALDGSIKGLEDVLECTTSSQSGIFNITTIFDKNSPYEIGYYINEETGVKTRYDSTVLATDFIDVSAFKFIEYTRNVNRSHLLAFYDSTKTYISGQKDISSPAGNICLEVPSGAKYVRLSFYTAYLDEIEARGYSLPSTTGILIDAYSTKNRNVSSNSNSPWQLPSANYSYRYGVKIVALLADVKTTGTLTVGIAEENSGGTTADNLVSSEAVTVDRIGSQMFILDNPLTIAQGQVVTLSVPTDTVTFSIGNYGLEKGFISKTGQTYTSSIGVTVVYSSGNSSKEYVSERLDRIESQLSPMDESVYKGKTLSILGDSISTFAGFIPQGNANFYTGANCGVASVNDTWWTKLKNALGMTIAINQSWSGSRVTTTNGTDSAGCMARCQNLGSNPNVIIVYMGINDFNNEVALGTYDGNGDFPTVTTTFREAYAIMLNKIMTAYPRAEIWCATLPSCERNGSIGAPEKNGNGVLLNDFNDAIRQLANVFGAKVLEHALCGITYQNMNVYMGDFDSSSNALHPNAAGHTLIANNDIRQIDAGCRTRY